jgi:hypothetical protein
MGGPLKPAVGLSGAVRYKKTKSNHHTQAKEACVGHLGKVALAPTPAGRFLLNWNSGLQASATF